PLRAKKGATHRVMMIYSDPVATEFVDTPFLDACPYFKHVLASFECDVRAARLMKLTPGSVIKPHTDHDLCFEDGKARLHIPVTTNADVEFLLNGTRVIMDDGTCWYLRLSETHQVANRGATDRIHLVIDTMVNDWMRNLFAQALANAL
ncbi:MAG TPA: aspartyl/asparaginyl beta-hydroxylase domain-containing protein, partial [Planctomycetota bacterium]|nr:aspartyl/asparaginyl beta-hydroxylase domain-containing protein [Planctomycetota bacterium]